MATNIISMNRGDTFEFALNIADKNFVDTAYILQGNDAIYFGLMLPNQSFEEAIIRKKIAAGSSCVASTGEITITLTPEDTLELLPGRYYYMIKLKLDHISNGQRIQGVETVINKTKFIIYD